MEESATVRTIRRGLLLILVLGLAGTAAELLLLKHTEDFWQILPLALIGISLPVLLWHAALPGRASLRVFQALMGIFVLTGLAGTLLHYRGNVEWELERMPGIGGFELVRSALMGATPALAPGTMVLLGLVGLLYTFRHPGLQRPGADSSSTGLDP